MFLLVFVSCVEEEDPYPWGKCPGPVNANAIDLSVEYAPFIQDRNATESDTVDLDEFAIYFNIEPEIIREASLKGSLPGQAYALSCAASYNFQNIAGMTVTLNGDLGELAAGSDISHFFENSREISLSELENFEGVIPFMGYRFIGEIPNFSKIKSRTTLILKDGSRIVVNSTSPTLKTD